MSRISVTLLVLACGFPLVLFRACEHPEREVEAQRLAAIRAGADVLAVLGMEPWAAEAKAFLNRCEFHDLERADNVHNRQGAPWQALDAAYLPGNPATGQVSRICWNINTVNNVAPRHLAAIWLDELSHAMGRRDHEESDAAVVVLVEKWEAAHGLKWGEVAPGEQQFARYIREGYWWRR